MCRYHCRLQITYTDKVEVGGVPGRGAGGGSEVFVCVVQLGWRSDRPSTDLAQTRS